MDLIPGVEQGHYNHRSKEVDDGRAKHHVETTACLLVERNTAPSRFLEDFPSVSQVVHLGEEGPGRGGHEADGPDQSNHLLGLSSGRSG